MTTHVRSLEFEPVAFADLAWWVNHDRKKALRIIRILDETRENPFEGIGKPEPLKFELTGCWSRRIDAEHRIVYRVTDDRIRVIACRNHY
jgi:toxin YoeB